MDPLVPPPIWGIEQQQQETGCIYTLKDGWNKAEVVGARTGGEGERERKDWINTSTLHDVVQDVYMLEMSL